MGHNMGYITGPLALVGGIGATALGQPEIGLPLIASGMGGTIGQFAGGSKGAAIGSGVGGLAGLGAGMIPGVGSGATSALGGLGSEIKGLFGGGASSVLPGGQVPGMQLSPEMQQLAQQNPSLSGMDLNGATVAGAMPNAPTQQQVAGMLANPQGQSSLMNTIGKLSPMAAGMLGITDSLGSQVSPPTPPPSPPSGATRPQGQNLPPTQITGGQPLPNPTAAGSSYQPPPNFGITNPGQGWGGGQAQQASMMGRMLPLVARALGMNSAMTPYAGGAASPYTMPNADWGYGTPMGAKSVWDLLDMSNLPAVME